MSIKVIGGAMGGVFVPIVIEYAMQGADVPSIGLKWSGVAGVAIGAVDIGLVMANIGPFRMMRAETKEALLAFGASSLATGISILILENYDKAQHTRSSLRWDGCRHRSQWLTQWQQRWLSNTQAR